MIPWWRLQNSPLTRWFWRTWQHGETGRVVMLPFWKRPGVPGCAICEENWSVVRWRD